MNRRAFISAAGVAVAGTSLLGFANACAGERTGLTAPPPATGSVRGTVVDMDERALPIGRVFLLQKGGLNVGVYADVDAAGGFNFGDVEVGEYQLRYWGANLAAVPDPLPNPVRISVKSATAEVVRFQVVVGAGNSGSYRDIYAGDFFFQEQPSGTPNSTVVVRSGTFICWYNVGTMLHTVTGGPWGDSGPISVDGNFVWIASEVGTFQYSCSFHRTLMVATLQVIG